MARVLASLMHDGFSQLLAGCSRFGHHCQDVIFCSAAIRSCQSWDQALHFWQLMPQAGPGDGGFEARGHDQSFVARAQVSLKPNVVACNSALARYAGFGSRFLRRLVKGQLILESFDSGQGK